MARLLLLRHAEALPASPDGDFARPLSPRGRDDATRLGARLRAENLIPDATLASSARRTRETAELVLAGSSGAAAPRFEAVLYNAGPETLLAAFSRAAGDTVLLVAHNPGVAALARALAAQVDATAASAINAGFPPCALAVFEADAKKPLSSPIRLLRFVTPDP